jgi:hypothetical protein
MGQGYEALGTARQMKLVTWLIVPLLVLLVAGSAFFYLRGRGGVYATSGLSAGVCLANDEIDPATREDLHSTALEFIALFARAPLEARAQMSRRGRAATREREALTNAQAIYRAAETPEPPEVTETYLLRFLSGSETGPHVPCNFRDGRPAFAARGGTPMSAVVLMTEEMPGASERTTTVWLEHENGAWRVRAINFGLSRIAGMDSEQMWEAARQQRARDHDFNAAMLYVAAQTAAQRGSFYQLRMMQYFNQDYRTFTAPELLQGPPPFSWTFRGETFRVNGVQYTGFESGDVGLIIDHAPAAWAENTEAEAINRRLIDGFVAANPHWRETFDAIVARAAKPGSNQRWGTVYTATRGYDAPPDIE